MKTINIRTYPFLALVAWICASVGAQAQILRQLEDERNRADHFASDSVETTDVPEGLDMWQVDERFGDIVRAVPDTSMTLFQNDAFTSGRTGRYNFTGNFGAPRVSRVWFDQPADAMHGGFLFAQPYDYFLREPSALWYTNTKSPFTNLTYHECGNKTNGEDRISGLFATNVNKRFGFGFEGDYLYGRGYYANQSTSQITGRLFASYIGERYDLHASVSTHYLKTGENGGLEDDTYITNPEAFATSYDEADMPTRLSKTWNRQHLFTTLLSHRYRLGFRRYRDTKGRVVHASQIGGLVGNALGSMAALPDAQPPLLPAKPVAPQGIDLANRTAAAAADSAALPDSLRPLTLAERQRPDAPDSLRLTQEFVPVASIVHTLRVDADWRQLRSNLPMNAANSSYFLDFYLPGDSTADRTHYTRVRNMLSLEINEGFSRWMRTGLRLYAAHEYERFTLPRLDLSEEAFTQHYVTLGARLLSTRGRYFRYDAFAETRSDGKSWGEFLASARADGSLPLFGDTLQVTLNGTARSDRPDFYLEHYHARNAWWDNESAFDKVMRLRLAGTLRWKGTRLSAGVETIQNYAYLAETTQLADGDTPQLFGVSARQASKNLQVLSATLSQEVRMGIFRWQGELTAQATSDRDILPLPALNAYTNMYIDFRIARVLHTQIGADLYWFTKYYAPAYSPVIGQYAVQAADNRVKIGGYPVVNAYANFHLKRTRFYIMASHVNHADGTGRPFLVPHYPLNELVLRFGVSWNFIN
ncbi:MAG: putative porin [Bacteroidaceae bacterium]|nr:putative porin [Bacteroidaceae bacterium]